jgi:(E)-4-hydroxy-3-methyl-but-2-enyl pyrophosphate reductase
VVFSAHGVPKSVPAAAKSREMVYLDATCPLVSKVHVEAQKHFDAGREIVLIGHAGHPEVVGTMGQLPEGTVTLIEDIDDARAWIPKNPANVAFLTQTTLSVDDTAEMVGLLKQRFPGIAAPHKEDICYATTNRQEAVKMLAEASELILVVGSKNSSNSVRLMEVGKRAGARDARLIDDAARHRLVVVRGRVDAVGVTAGASAPEDIPFQYALADAFTLCDAYHCATQTGTNTNRLFLWTGTNDPAGSMGGPSISNSHDDWPTGRSGRSAIAGRPIPSGCWPPASPGASTRTWPTTSPTTRWPGSRPSATAMPARRARTRA